jgi:FkbM family methyltransferase
MKRNIVKRFLYQFGYAILRLKRTSDDMTYPLSRIYSEIDVVVDVGVAKGTPDLYEGLKGKPIVLIEAFPQYFDFLIREYPEATLIRECLSDKVEELDFYVRDKSSTSSLNKGVDFSKTLNLVTKTLDSALSGFVQENDRVCLKLDTEGSELKILKGASQILNQCPYVISEATLNPTLQGSNNMFELIDFMRSVGFSIYDFVNIRKNKDRIDQLDIIFQSNNQIIK